MAAAASALLGLSILVIGDSHMATPNYLIGSLHDGLMEQGATVHSIGVCGTHSSDWTKTVKGTCGGAERTSAEPAASLGANASTQPVASLISKDKADLVVVIQGDTIASYPNPEFPKTWAWGQVTDLTKAIAATGTACVWVGPAWGTEGGKYGKNFKRVEELNAFLAENVAPCKYIDSTKFSQPGEWKTIDGQHLTGTNYKKWGAAITEAIVAAAPAKKN
ncbi:MAG: SGNH/GDSL hydrolase family protein [Pseudomonadota bacterium]